MSAKSASQRRLMGWVYACVKGKTDNCPEWLMNIAHSFMKKGKRKGLKNLKDFAKTKHEGLPERIEREPKPKKVVKKRKKYTKRKNESLIMDFDSFNESLKVTNILNKIKGISIDDDGAEDLKNYFGIEKNQLEDIVQYLLDKDFSCLVNIWLSELSDRMGYSSEDYFVMEFEKPVKTRNDPNGDPHIFRFLRKEIMDELYDIDKHLLRHNLCVFYISNIEESDLVKTTGVNLFVGKANNEQISKWRERNLSGILN